MTLEPRACPNPRCPHSLPAGESRERFYRRKGSFPRAGERRVARFQCKGCGKHFSEQTFAADYREKKPEITPALERLAEAGYSARSAARLLGVNRKTVARRYRRRLARLRRTGRG